MLRRQQPALRRRIRRSAKTNGAAASEVRLSRTRHSSFSTTKALVTRSVNRRRFSACRTLCERGKAVCPDGNTVPNAPGGGFDFSDYPAVSTINVGSTKACSTTATLASGQLYGSPACPYVMIPYASSTPLGRAFFNMYPLPNNGSGLTNNYTSAPVKTFNSKTL